MPMKSSATTAPIVLGTCVEEADEPLKVFYEGAEMKPHKGKPWLLSWLKKRDGKVLTYPKKPIGEVTIPADWLKAHAIHVGNSDSGKTRLALHLFREQLKRGCSGVFMDFKSETIQHAIQCALDAGMSKEQITVIWPADDRHGVPGWNPFAASLDEIDNAVGRFTSTLKGCFTSWGPSMDNLLRNAGVVMSGQGLSLWELVEFIQPSSEAYRTAVLNQARTSPAWAEFPKRHEYFDTQFKSVAKTESIPATLNKLTTLISNRYLKSMLCAKTDQLRLDTLWTEPRVILIHLDQHVLSYDGAGLLAGLIAQNLFSIAMRKPGDVPVVVVMDEIESQERYLGDSLADILAKSRSQGIRMIGACQNIDQMSPRLQNLFDGANLSAYFNMTWKDAKLVAPALTTDIETRDTRVSITAHKTDWVNVAAAIVDRHGNLLNVSEASWKLFETVGRKSLKALQSIAAACNIPTLYVLSPFDQKRIRLDTYLEGVPSDLYVFTGPASIKVTVSFPRPVYKAEEKRTQSDRTELMKGKLKNLGKGECVIKIRGGAVSHIKVVDVSFARLPNPAKFLGNGQSPDVIAETVKGREAAIVALSGRRPVVNGADYQEVSEDGNL